MDKYINYKSQGKMLRKKFKSYKPFWNSELTSLWKDMCHKERSVRCLTSNLQHKKSLRMKFSTARKTFDKRLRYYERQYNKNTRLGQLGANISPDRSSLTPQVLIGNFLKHNYPLLCELQHINLLCLYLPKEDGVSPDAEYITQIIFSIFLQ